MVVQSAAERKTVLSGGGKERMKQFLMKLVFFLGSWLCHVVPIFHAIGSIEEPDLPFLHAICNILEMEQLLVAGSCLLC